MIKFCLAFTLSFSSLIASDPLDLYFDYLDRYPQTLGPLGDAANGEIEILRDREKIREIGEKTGRTIGIVKRDKYWIWINDPVKFPGDKYGVYGRLLWIQSLEGPTGVAVMPILPNGKIVLNRNYRHATRSWEYELPRGAINPEEAIEAAATREVEEETGMVIDQLVLLGNVATDSGVTNAVIPIYLAKVLSKHEAAPEESEAISGIEAFSLTEIKQGYINGYLSSTLEGKTHKIPLRDPYLAFALFQADIRNLLVQLDKSF